MANAFKSGASQSRTTNDFNERAKQLSERLGAIEKPVQMKRANAPRRSFKSGPQAEPGSEPKGEVVEAQSDAESPEAENESDA